MGATGDNSGLGFYCNTLCFKIIESFTEIEITGCCFLIWWGDEKWGTLSL